MSTGVLDPLVDGGLRVEALELVGLRASMHA